MNTALAVGILAVFCLFRGLLVRGLGFPAITGYLLVGILLGASVSNILSSEIVNQFSHVVTSLALGFIAYLIGGSLPQSIIRGLAPADDPMNFPLGQKTTLELTAADRIGLIPGR